MANKRVTELPVLTEWADDDEVLVTDVSDVDSVPESAPDGTLKRVGWRETLTEIGRNTCLRWFYNNTIGAVNILHGYEGNAIADDVYGSTISGGGGEGQENVIGGDTSTVGSGTPNVKVTGSGAHLGIIGGGYDNVIGDGVANIATGYHVQTNNTTHATIAGGSYHEAHDGDYMTISGGTLNKATAQSVVAGGVSNTAGVAGVTGASVLGGKNNTASGSYASIGGGEANTASGNYATIVGGANNLAPNPRATVIGGENNECAASYGFATGKDARASNYGQVSHASGMIAARGDAQRSAFLLKRVTTDASLSLLSRSLPNVNDNIQLPVGVRALMVCRVVATEPSTGDSKAWTSSFLVQNPVGANVSVVGSTPVWSVVGATSGASLWDVSFLPGADSASIRVYGEVGKTINWVGSIDMVEVI